MKQTSFGWLVVEMYFKMEILKRLGELKQFKLNCNIVDYEQVVRCGYLYKQRFTYDRAYLFNRFYVHVLCGTVAAGNTTLSIGHGVHLAVNE